MRIAIDIDSTLHHYWDLLSAAAQRRFGIDLPYEEQYSWGITRLKAEQLKVCEADTHCEATILGARPYAGAVRAINAWGDAGHFVHVTSHRPVSCHAATGRWLETIGLRHDELHLSTDKLSRCCETSIDLLIDDCPGTLSGALEHGISAATLLHPWNEELVEEEGDAILAAPDWPGLVVLLEQRFPPLRRRRPAAAAAPAEPAPATSALA